MGFQVCRYVVSQVFHYAFDFGKQHWCGDLWVRSSPGTEGVFTQVQVSEKPTQVRVNTLLTPRHITQRSKVRMHARRYHPKKDSPKVRQWWFV